jgi:hypothetical protein
MKLAKKLSLLTILATAALGTSYAVDAQARFSLPQAAHVGSSVLPAGDYMVTMSVDGSAKAIIIPVGHSGESVIALPTVIDAYASCAESSLQMERTGSEWSVRSVCFAPLQVSMYFAAPSTKSALTAVSTDAAVIAGAAK